MTTRILVVDDEPARQCTRLSLSLSCDIVVKQHGGQFTVDSLVGESNELVVTLPWRVVTADGGSV